MQWTGIVTSIAIEMLESGRVDAVVCVQNDENDRFSPKPVRNRIARLSCQLDEHASVVWGIDREPATCPASRKTSSS